MEFCKNANSSYICKAPPMRRVTSQSEDGPVSIAKENNYLLVGLNSKRKGYYISRYVLTGKHENVPQIRET